MKNIANIKIKTCIAIFITINLILQPVCIYIYITGKFNIFDIIMNLYADLYLTFSFSVIANEYIFKSIFVGMLKGKMIRKESGNLLLSVYFILNIVLLLMWILHLIMKEYDNNFALYVLLLIPLMEIKNTYIISNGYLFCGFTVIQLDTINWFKITKKGRSRTITIRYQGNKAFGTVNTARSIEELAEYFETHQIKQRYYTNIA